MELELVEFLLVWKAWLSDSAKRTAYGWDATECGRVVSRIGDFTEAREAYEADKTPGNRLTKDEAKEAAVAAVRAFANTSVRFNPKMTDAEKLALGIRPRDANPTPVPAPAVTPEIDAMPSGRRQHTVTAINPATKSKKRPDLVRGVAFAHKLRLPDEPKADAEAMPSVFQTKTVRDFQWKEADVGKVADYAVVYEKEGGGRGEWSDIASVTVA